MSRHTPRWLLAALLTAGFALAAVAMTGTTPPADAHCVHVEELEVYVCGTTTSTTSSTTTSSTTSTTTSSTTSTSSTTTTAPTTTTTEATTTTVAQGALLIPETEPYPSQGFKESESFKFTIRCIDTEPDPRNPDAVLVVCDKNGGNGQIATFDYIGHNMPYIYSEGVDGNHDHAWWVAGDREGYRCGYAFMYDKHPSPFGHTDIIRGPGEGVFIARATILRPPGQSYGGLNDTYMAEGQRYYDGTVADEDGREISESCVGAAIDDFDYDAYVPEGPDDIRVGLFRADGEIGDIRDFTVTDLQNPGHWEFVGLEDGRVTIVFILAKTGKVSHVFYYHAMNTGRIAVEVNGATIQDS